MPGKFDALGHAVRRLAGADELAELATRHPKYADALRTLAEGGQLPPSPQSLALDANQKWAVTDDLGGHAHGFFHQAVGPRAVEPPYWEPHHDANRNKVARIVGMGAVPYDLKYTAADELFRRRGFLSGLLDTLEQEGAARVAINLQSDDTRRAMQRLVDKGRIAPMYPWPLDKSRSATLWNLRPSR